jgi:hypothetical protein
MLSPSVESANVGSSHGPPATYREPRTTRRFLEATFLPRTLADFTVGFFFFLLVAEVRTEAFLTAVLRVAALAVAFFVDTFLAVRPKDKVELTVNARRIARNRDRGGRNVMSRV